MTDEMIKTAKTLIECTLVTYEGDPIATQKMYIRARTLESR